MNLAPLDIDGLRRIVDAARARGIVVFTHAKPDGDAVGSAAAIARTMERVGVEAQVIFVGPVPRWIGDVMRDTAWREIPPNSTFAGDAGVDGAAVAIVDTGSWSQLSELKTWLQGEGGGRRERTLMIDHHRHNDPDVGSVRVVDPDAASATEVVARIALLVLGARTLDDIPVEIAEPLYLGLATDTGWFRHSNTTAGTLALASVLVRAGAAPAKLFELIEQREDPSRLRLLSRALGSLRIEHAGRVAVMALTLKDFEDTRARRTESGGFIDHAMTLDGVEVAAMFTEEPPAHGKPAVKVSLRSKAFGSRPGFQPVDVNDVCRAFGGGGHARAAGAKLEGATLADAIARVVAAIPG
jgi:phosphoesterase RecJ-like protein